MTWYIDDLKTLRVGAALSRPKLARAAQLHEDTITRIEKRKPCRQQTCIAVVTALNSLHYGGNGKTLDPNRVVTSRSRFGGNNDNQLQ
jgi:DNA-binding XRE family transcriptional regulator